MRKGRAKLHKDLQGALEELQKALEGALGDNITMEQREEAIESSKTAHERVDIVRHLIEDGDVELSSAESTFQAQEQALANARVQLAQSRIELAREQLSRGGVSSFLELSSEPVSVWDLTHTDGEGEDANRRFDHPRNNKTWSLGPEYTYEHYAGAKGPEPRRSEEDGKWEFNAQDDDDVEESATGTGMNTCACPADPCSCAGEGCNVIVGTWCSSVPVFEREARE